MPPSPVADLTVTELTGCLSTPGCRAPERAPDKPLRVRVIVAAGNLARALGFAPCHLGISCLAQPVERSSTYRVLEVLRVGAPGNYASRSPDVGVFTLRYARQVAETATVSIESRLYSPPPLVPARYHPLPALTCSPPTWPLAQLQPASPCALPPLQSFLLAPILPFGTAGLPRVFPRAAATSALLLASLLGFWCGCKARHIPARRRYPRPLARPQLGPWHCCTARGLLARHRLLRPLARLRLGLCLGCPIRCLPARHRRPRPPARLRLDLRHGCTNRWLHARRRHPRPLARRRLDLRPGCSVRGFPVLRRHLRPPTRRRLGIWLYCPNSCLSARRRHISPTACPTLVAWQFRIQDKGGEVRTGANRWQGDLVSNSPGKELKTKTLRGIKKT